MPTEVYRNWRYRFIVPPGFVGFIGETIVQRRSRQYVYEGTFHDRFVPFALATSLELSTMQRMSFSSTWYPRATPWTPPTDKRFAQDVLSQLTTTASQALFSPEKTFIWLGDEGDTIAFDHHQASIFTSDSSKASRAQ